MVTGIRKAIVVVALLMLALPAAVHAVPLHDFDCQDCHGTTVPLSSITSNVCLNCHNAANPVTKADGSSATPSGILDGGDASNAMGNNPAAINQTSHFWGPTETVPAAGAQAAANPLFALRVGYSNGTVACSRCHHPHEDGTRNPSLLKLPPYVDRYGNGPYTPNDMCLDCHRAWDTSANHGIETHPMGGSLSAAATAQPDAYHATPQQTGASDITLLPDGTISCTTCHGVHWVDSDASTADTMNNGNAGDGLLLKHNGPANETIDTSICQSCHKYRGHAPNAPMANQLGCLVCHGGHEYDPNGQPNIFMLKKQITLDTTNIKAAGSVNDTVTLDYTAYPPAANYDNGGGEGSLCLSCHDFPAGHTAGSACADCHAHDQNTGSFSAGCGSCHGYAPELNAPGNTNPGGYAVSTQTGNDYNASGVFKDESQTPHARHANGAGNYTFACDACHGDGAGLLGSADHDNNDFQQVLDTAIGTLPALTTNNGATSPTYDTNFGGSCSAVYCHSNGDPRDGAITFAADPAWQNGAGDITTCDACHGNSAATMATSGNSAVHQDHLGAATALLGKSYSCAVCHSGTAQDANNLLASAIGGTHVDGVKDVVSGMSAAGLAGSPTEFSYASVAGTCSTAYCHSDGKGNFATPDWDGGAASCTYCHNNGTDDGALANAAPNSGAHGVHMSQGLSCSACHSHNGSSASHIDGNIGVPPMSACDTCHGATDGGTGVDAEPAWTDPTSVSCETCHQGTLAVIGGNTAPAKDIFETLGHGGVAGFGGDCESCHSLSADHIGGAASDMLTGGATAGNAFCQTCHGTSEAHYNNSFTTGGSSINGDTCADCHEPHGEGMGTNSDVMLIVGDNFTDRSQRASYQNATYTGVCQVCHDSGEVAHFNQGVQDTAHFSGQVCTDCHKHTDAPAFQPNANSCGACHDSMMATAPHTAHVNKLGGIIEDDLTDCTFCHDGADQYTLAGSANGNHRNGSVQVAAALGYNATDQTCTQTCHSSSTTDGNWGDTALNCDACHGTPPVDGGGDGSAHQDHLAAGVSCATCHAVPGAGDTSHITDQSGATDLAVLTGMADAVADEAAVIEASFNDTTNTCSTAVCHNPSADGHVADWDTSTSSCLLCHNNDVASGTPMVTGSHSQHINNAALIGDNATCADCHGDTTAGGTDTAHLNSTVDFVAAAGWGSTAPQTCASNSSCHTDGYDPVESPAWGAVVDPATVCDLCHEAPDNSGDHLAHWIPGRTDLGLQCASCHFDTVNANADPLNTLTTIKTGGSHINGNLEDVVEGYDYESVAVTIEYSPGSPANCTANCHTVNPKPWQPQTGCASCHGDLAYVGDVHTAHIDNTGSIETDVSECVVCHGADVGTYTGTGGDGGSGNHQNASIETAAGIGTAATGCAAACHGSDAADGNWADADGLNCTACHNNGTNDNVIANAAPATGDHTAHVVDQGMQCVDCHGALPTDATHASGLDAAGDAGADQGETLTNKATAIADNATVDDSPFDHAGNTFNDTANSCSNTYCHDPSNNTTTAVWGTDTADCTLCHGYTDASGTVMASGTHSQHLTAEATFGLTALNDCAACHANDGTTGHFISATGPTTVNQAVQFGGTVVDGTTVVYTEAADTLPMDATYGTCGTNSCHNNGRGGATGAYLWAGAPMNNCNTCHNAKPATDAHVIHTGTTAYGPHASGSTDCGECHNANANNTSMAGMGTHINGDINYNDATSVAAHGGLFGAGTGIVGDTAVTVCNTCHGGQTAADLAKNNWVTLAPVGCESCHGDYDLAQINGVTAPSRAGSGYDAAGHGKAGIAQGCADCHDSSAAHITGAGTDGNRLTGTPGGTALDYAADANGWCNACHATSMPVHYDNGQTAGGASDPGVLCTTCHDQHGQNSGQAQMVAATIATRSVTGFSDKDLRDSYGNPAPNYDGVCQVCHDGSEVNYFNRGSEGTTHNASGACLDCHQHEGGSLGIAFEPSGCSGCHGGGTSGAVAKNYWPDGSTAPDRAGEHLAHMDQLAQRVYGMSATALLDQGTADAAQKVLCAYCHDNPGSGAAHNDGSIDTNGFKALWDAGVASTTSYTGGNASCANSCHNGKATAGGQNWYDNGATSCALCHTVGGSGANPNTGLHDIATAGVQAHDDSLTANGCAECHAKPAMSQTSSHIDGTFAAESGVNTDRFLNNTNFTYSEAPVNTSTCTSTCHSDGGAWARLWSTTADSAATALGSARCDVCHGQLNNWRAGMSVDHDLARVNDGTHTQCTQCHVAPDAPYDFASMHNTTATTNEVEINNNTGMSYNTAAGSCSVASCHGSGTPTRSMGASTIFAENLLNGPGASCNTCHLATGGSNNTNTVGAYTFTSQTGAHAQHVQSAATAYGGTAGTSVDTAYDYGCGVCHPTDEGTYHLDGSVNLLLDPTTAPATIKGLNDGSAAYSGGTCSGVYCHSDGVDVAASTTPDFLTGSFSDPNGDYCQNCHGNQPTTGSHAAHVVGIHYDDIYDLQNGGLLADAAPTGGGHGDVATAITINCNLCHADTLNQWRNDNNTACVGCHGGQGNAVTADDVDLKKTVHVNGSKEVVFNAALAVRSKAQIRDFSGIPAEDNYAPELANNWTRQNGYKAGSTSHDVSGTLDTGTMWDGGTSNCTVACHNGNAVTWGQANVSCNDCHTQLPK